MSVKAIAASAAAVLAPLTLIGCSSSSTPDQPSTTIAAATTRPVSATPGSSPAAAGARRSACVGLVAVLGLAARSHAGDPQWSLQQAADELMTEWLSSPDAATATPDENAGFTAGARDAVALVSRGQGDDQCP
ncbi:hypothetical protein KHQ06_27560 [Nocardia tengchongensis]|uniref:DUF732 domain-containing protein n=1 Tax=Nocardia tengchongensis TaxID=2055889 RepID=A0ABX8CJ52_9NOCA|nr:hypothetical protein [Nocardia tengchongensis]QVI20002.1 hypothetical protein KHQ06_27560 [Nocardia tengchongensis]